MRYLPEHKIAFIHNPKTAGTSISSWLDNNFKTVPGRKHGNYNEVTAFFPDTVFTFGVVRNPWERLASWYTFSAPPTTPFKKWLIERLFEYRPGLSFNSNLMWASQWYNIATPQADWFGDNINLVLRFENLQEDFKQIKNLLTCNTDLSILNNSNQYDYRSYYDNELVDLVQDIYIKDIIKYGYRYEI